MLTYFDCCCSNVFSSLAYRTSTFTIFDNRRSSVRAGERSHACVVSDRGNLFVSLSEVISPKSVPSNKSSSPRLITTRLSPNVTPIPVVQTFLVSSTAPLATMDEDFPSIPYLRDTSIEDQYIEIRRLTKPPSHDQTYLTEYDSCTVLSSADPSISGYRRRQGRNPTDHDDDDDTISSKSGIMDDDEHAQISHMITTTFTHEHSDLHRIKRSPSFYDNVTDDPPLNNSYRRPPTYAFETGIR